MNANTERTLAKNRRLLAALGIDVWASRHAQVVALPDRFRLQAHEVNGNQTNHHQVAVPVLPTPKPSPSLNDIAKQVQMPSATLTPNDAPSDTTQRQTPVVKHATPQHATHLNLEGIRFGAWVLIVDRGFMNHELEQIWTALKSALQDYARQTAAPFFVHQLMHPWAAIDLALWADDLVQGFLFRLNMPSQASMVASLTELSPLQSLKSLSDDVKSYANLPTLIQMCQNPELKRTLWQQLTTQTQNQPTHSSDLSGEGK